MTTLSPRVRAVALLAVMVAAVVAADEAWCQAPQKHVLMLSEYRPDNAVGFLVLIRSGIEAEFKEQLNYFTEHIDARMFGDEEYPHALRDFFSPQGTGDRSSMS